ncbi:MAG: HEAT repeat domain-containing protein [Myxococcota bacterium]|nr:HEAT repeat domain-containing protein [Myxococcota bacterium]
MSYRRRQLGLRAIVLGALVALAAAFVPVGWAQSDHSTMVRVLRQSPDFRARVRAALALGSTDDHGVTRHLVRALRDENPAVRAAAATALGRLGDAAALDPLRRLERDEERVVRDEARQAIRRIEVATRGSRPSGPSAPARVGPRRSGDAYPAIAVVPRARDIYWPRIRYVVVLGDMQNRSSFRDDSLAEVLQQEVSRNLLVLRGVAVFREGELDAEAQRQISRRSLPKLRLEGSLNRVERRRQRRQLTVRCEVSLMLMDEPERNLRGMLQGAAEGSQPQRRGARREQEASLARQALTGAVRGAMSGAARAISTAGRR